MNRYIATKSSGRQEQPGIATQHHAAEREASTGRSVRLISFHADHREEVFQLYRRVFGPGPADAFQERWQWAQEECLYPGSNPKWVLLDRQRVVGFLATVPLPYAVRGTKVLACTPCDFMVHPEYRFHGVRLMKELFRTCENCVTCDDIPSTIKVTRWLGARQVGLLARYVMLLDSRSLRGSRRWAGTAPLRWPINLLLRWSARRRMYANQGRFTVEPAYEFDQRFQDFFHRLTALVPMMPARDTRFLEWRYGSKSPHATREIGVVADQGDDLLGYVVFYLSRSSQRHGYILDLQTLPHQSREVGSALLSYAVDQLRDRGAWSIRYHHLASPNTLPARALKQHGFIPRGGHQLLVRFQDPSVAHLAGFAGNWSYNYGDSEASHSCI